MLIPVVVYIRPELLHEVQIQAMREGYDLDAVTEMSYENYLSLGYSDEELKEIHGQERYKEIEAEVEMLEREWEAGRKEREKWLTREKALWDRKMKKVLAQLTKDAKASKKSHKKLELKTELPKLTFDF